MATCGTSSIDKLVLHIVDIPNRVFLGRVKIAKHVITGKYAAIKIVPKGLILTSRMSMSEAGARADKILLGIEREIVIMKLIDHPNVLNLYDVWETSGEL